MIRHTRLRGGVFLLVAFVGCSKRPSPIDSVVTLPSAAATPSASVLSEVISPRDAPASSAATPKRCDALFEPPPGARLLCSEHVLGNTMEIAWRSYATSQQASELFAPYHAKIGGCAGVTEGPGFRLEKGLLHLTVQAATEKGYPTCEKAPTSGEASVVVISQAHER